MIRRSAVLKVLKYLWVAGLLAVIVVTIRTSPAPIKYSDMLVTRWTAGRAPTVGQTALGTQLSCADRRTWKGISTVAPSTLVLQFTPHAHKLEGECCVDDRCRGSGAIRCSVMEGKNVLFESGLLNPGDTPQPFSVDVSTGTVLLIMDQEGDRTNCKLANWTRLRTR